jgi:hypothetical protein
MAACPPGLVRTVGVGVDRDVGDRVAAADEKLVCAEVAVKQGKHAAGAGAAANRVRI